MKKHRLVKAATAMVLAISASISPMHYTMADTLNDAVEIKQEAQGNLTDTKGRMESIKKKQKVLHEKIQKLDEDLVGILVDISILEDEIVEKQGQVAETENRVSNAQADMDRQYESMKLRIQYMYENNGLDNGIEATERLTENSTIGSLLNRTVYSENIYEYDRQRLNAYEQVKKKAMLLMEELKEERDELFEKENSLQEQKELLQEKISNKRKISKGFKNKLRKSKALAKQYKETIKEQNAIIQEEIQRISEELANSYSVNDDYKINYDEEGSEGGRQIAEFALKFVGNPYVWGGNSLTNGIDCSGFVKAVYAHFGYSLPRTSKEQRAVGRSVSASELQPGDIVCYSGHVAIYIGGGKIVHASNPTSGIKISDNVFYRTVLGFRRVI